MSKWGKLGTGSVDGRKAVDVEVDGRKAVDVEVEE